MKLLKRDFIKMKVLIACESSEIIKKTFHKLGHDAWSCDLLPGEQGGYKHVQEDIFKFILNTYYEWDLVIAHPPCTHLSVSGARWFKEKQKEQKAAIRFFMGFTRLPINKICIENPVSIMSTIYRKPNQIIQPWQFGEDASKKTCLWLKNLPLLIPTKIITKKQYVNQTPSGQNKLGPSSTRSADRSRTYQGIANAMAKQWG